MSAATEPSAPWGVPLERDVVLATGPDAATYLQGQLSQDIAAVDVGASTWSLLLTPQGHLVALLRVTRTDEEAFALDTDAGAGQAVLDRLQRFLLRTRCQLAPAPWGCLAVRGHAATPPASRPGSAWVVQPEVPGPDGYDLLGPDASLPAGVEPGDPAAYEALRIERGVPRAGRELGERTIPAEAGIVDRATSFTKGCYTGQELVARIDSRGGNVPRRLRGLAVAAGAEVPAPGATVLVGEQEVGSVTSATWSAARGAPVALAYARRGTDVPSPCTVRWEGATVPATLVELPIG